MKLFPALLLGFGLALPLPFSAMADEETPAAATETAKVNLSEFKFGKTLSGTEVTAESLKGSPVVVEFWGVNCGPCLAAMPMFNTLAKRHESKGLKVIGAHSQNATEEEVLKKVKALKIKFPVTANAIHPLKFSGIPHSVVFDAEGNMLFEGHPNDKGFDRAVKAALRTAGETTSKATDTPASGLVKTGPLIAERTWTNAEGKPVAATLVKVVDGIGTFRRKDGASFTYDVKKLSTTDQELISEALKP